MLAVLPLGPPASPGLPGHYGTRSSRPSPQIPELWPLARLPPVVSFPLTVVVPGLTPRNPDELNELYHLVASVYPRVKKQPPLPDYMEPGHSRQAHILHHLSTICKRSPTPKHFWRYHLHWF